MLEGIVSGTAVVGLRNQSHQSSVGADRFSQVPRFLALPLHHWLSAIDLY